MPPTPPPSLPPSQPAPFRHLGTGAVDRSVRVQMIIALVAGLVMVAVPLYLWRRPRSENGVDSKRSGSAESSASGNGLSALAPGGGSAAAAANSMAAEPPVAKGVTISEPKVVKCSKAGPGKTAPEMCDHQPFFEEALTKAVRDNASCAPLLPTGGTINYVLDVDHKTKKVKAWAGKSGSVKKKQTKEVLACVNRSLPTPDWSQVPHQHTKYRIAVMATYPPSGGAGGPLSVRLFRRPRRPGGSPPLPPAAPRSFSGSSRSPAGRGHLRPTAERPRARRHPPPRRPPR
jgi:hypothetical protein